jgi:O-succinylbenzoic acid--CoA ligase
MLTTNLPTTLDQSRDGYPYGEIWINGRHVSLEKIVHEHETHRSRFEESTFRFIKEWLAGETVFTMATSGSTGTPKTISVSREHMIASATRTARKIGLQKNLKALVCIDTKYIAGKMMVVRALTTGMRLFALDPSANPLVKIPIDNCVQFTAFVPYQLSAILESKHPHLLNNLDKVLIGGAPVSESIREELGRFQCSCYETYGMTETVSHVALRLLNTKMKQRYFEALPGVSLTQDDRGCLVISADYIDHPLVTNDLVEFSGEGQFVWLGRWDNVINSGGVKVVPERIETQLEAILVNLKIHYRFFVAALPDERLGSKVVLVIEGQGSTSESLLAALRQLKAAVSPYEFPKEVYGISEFILTGNGKVDRAKSLSGAIFLFIPK